MLERVKKIKSLYCVPLSKFALDRLRREKVKNAEMVRVSRCGKKA
jgi:hypothetical protein